MKESIFHNVDILERDGHILSSLILIEKRFPILEFGLPA
jgi:hypothetical protein